MDIARAREALEDLLKSNAASATSVRYYVKLALSHMQETDLKTIDETRRDNGE